jgi:hypothetical protein
LSATRISRKKPVFGFLSHKKIAKIAKRKKIPEFSSEEPRKPGNQKKGMGRYGGDKGIGTTTKESRKRPFSQKDRKGRQGLPFLDPF